LHRESGYFIFSRYWTLLMYTHTDNAAIRNNMIGVALVISGAVPVEMLVQGIRKALAN
jgi:hypothetical protein